MDSPTLPILDPATAAIVETTKAEWIAEHGNLEDAVSTTDGLQMWYDVMPWEHREKYLNWLGECYDIESCWEMSQQEQDKPEPHQCQHEGCTSQEAVQCDLNNYLEDNGPEKFTYYYCTEHAKQAGFCWGCGDFWGGVESFEFGNGLCENCLVEDEGYDDEDDFWGGEEYDWDDDDDQDEDGFNLMEWGQLH